jgi:hypothetical protein
MTNEQVSSFLAPRIEETPSGASFVFRYYAIRLFPKKQHSIYDKEESKLVRPGRVGMVPEA